MIYRTSSNSNVLMHYGVKGMKWGVRHDPERRAARKQSKETYKAIRKEMNEEENRRFKAYQKNNHDIFEIYKMGKVANKQAYKKGQISKENYQSYKKANAAWRTRELRRSEYNMAVGMYEVEHIKRANKLVYIEDIKGKESKAYKRGYEALKKNKEYYGVGSSTYTIHKDSKGQYHVSRTDVYFV